MVSIMASPTNRVREIVPAASGWRAIASIAAATERPSPSAGPIEPIETATAAAMMLMTFASIGLLSKLLHRCCRARDRFGLIRFATHCGADENGGEHKEDVRLHDADQKLERHERDRYEKPGKREHERDQEFPTHDVAEEAHHQGEGARDLRKHVEGQHDELRLSEDAEISQEPPGAHAEPVHGEEHDEGERRRCLDPAGGCLDTRHHAADVCREQEDEECPEERQQGSRVLADHLPDLTLDAAHHELEDRLSPGRLWAQAPRQEPRAYRKHRHDAPGGHDGSSYQKRAHVEDNCGGKRRALCHGALLAARTAICRAARKPRNAARNGHAPARTASPKKSTAAASRANVQATARHARL